MTLRFEHHKNFITPQECAELNTWVDEGVKNKWLDSGYDLNKRAWECDTRKTTRNYADRFTYPEIVCALSARIRKFCGISEYALIKRGGQDGIVVSCTSPGGDVYTHKDARSDDSLSILRCNVLTRAADSGGVLHIEGEPRPLEVGDLHCYLASEHEHYVSEVEGDTSRVLWMFGAHVPKEDWDSGLIKFGH